MSVAQLQQLRQAPHALDGKPTGKRRAWALALLIAAGIYCFGLGGPHIPTNGDEAVYAHILRITAQSGHWLPLQSELDQMRNTKPPMLFWQGLLSTDWGAQWSLVRLRWPSVAFTFATAALVAGLAWQASRSFRTACIAALCYLGFFATYRYGRPYLTNPPEVFFLFLPLVYAVAFPTAWAAGWRAGLRFVLIAGGCLGIAALYKSFALVAPVTLAWAGMALVQRQAPWAQIARAYALQLASAALLALAIFAIWFLADPQPQAIWQEFVVRENIGKVDPNPQGYWRTALWGGQSWLAYIGACLLNAGLLLAPVVALLGITWRERNTLSTTERMLWVWVASFVLVFALPSQRSGRYVLDAMPAVAVLLALRWQALPRWSFALVLAPAAALTLALGALAWAVHREAALDGASLTVLGVSAIGVAVAVLAGASRARFGAAAALFSSLLATAALGAVVHAFGGALGEYPRAAVSAMRGQTVFVPCNFRAGDEMRRFFWPGVDVRGYDDSHELDAAALADRYALFAVRGTLADPPCPGCEVLGTRWDLRSRQSSAQLTAIAHGDVLGNLFVRESLVRSPLALAPGADAPGTGAWSARPFHRVAPPPSECR